MIDLKADYSCRDKMVENIDIELNKVISAILTEKIPDIFNIPRN